MKMTVSVATLLLLMIISVSVWKSSGEDWPLDMAENSVDDCFKGCEKKMYDLVMEKYMKRETKNPNCAAAWEKALNNYTKGSIGKFQSVAIYMYTQPAIDKNNNINCSYKTFNNACRAGKADYQSDNFQFYTLYYFLTDAVRKLKKFPKWWRVTSYRRTKDTFANVTVNEKIRFGSFTSSSLLMNLTQFGEESCFKIETRYGAKVKKYSALPGEKEVLIPPYEVFRITAIKRRDEENENLWCKVVYELKSAGKMSDLRCAKTKTPSMWGLHHKISALF